jgi:hypothetical protein
MKQLWESAPKGVQDKQAGSGRIRDEVPKDGRHHARLMFRALQGPLFLHEGGP